MYFGRSCHLKIASARGFAARIVLVPGLSVVIESEDEQRGGRAVGPLLDSTVGRMCCGAWGRSGAPWSPVGSILFRCTIVFWQVMPFKNCLGARLRRADRIVLVPGHSVVIESEDERRGGRAVGPLLDFTVGRVCCGAWGRSGAPWSPVGSILFRCTLYFGRTCHLKIATAGGGPPPGRVK